MAVPSKALIKEAERRLREQNDRRLFGRQVALQGLAGGQRKSARDSIIERVCSRLSPAQAEVLVGLNPEEVRQLSVALAEAEYRRGAPPDDDEALGIIQARLAGMAAAQKRRRDPEIVAIRREIFGSFVDDTGNPVGWDRRTGELYAPRVYANPPPKPKPTRTPGDLEDAVYGYPEQSWVIRNANRSKLALAREKHPTPKGLFVMDVNTGFLSGTSPNYWEWSGRIEITAYVTLESPFLVPELTFAFRWPDLSRAGNAREFDAIWVKLQRWLDMVVARCAQHFTRPTGLHSTGFTLLLPKDVEL